MQRLCAYGDKRFVVCYYNEWFSVWVCMILLRTIHNQQEFLFRCCYILTDNQLESLNRKQWTCCLAPVLRQCHSVMHLPPVWGWLLDCSTSRKCQQSLLSLGPRRISDNLCPMSTVSHFSAIPSDCELYLQTLVYKGTGSLTFLWIDEGRPLAGSGLMPLSVYRFPKKDMLCCSMIHFVTVEHQTCFYSSFH